LLCSSRRMNPKIIPLAIVLSLLLVVGCYWILFVYVDQPCSTTMIRQYKRIQKHCESYLHSAGPWTGHSRHEVIWSHFWDPSWSCTLERRIGSHLNAKWLCDPHQIYPNGIIYSYGTSNSSFEEYLAKNYQCNVHLFDPKALLVSSSSSSSLTSFHLSLEKFSSQQFLQSLQQNQYQGRDLDLLSFEIYDWISCSESSKMSPVIASFLSENLLTELEALQISVEQLSFTFHHEADLTQISHTASALTENPSCQPYSDQQSSGATSPSHQITLLFQHLTSRGYAIYHREIIPRLSSSEPSSRSHHDQPHLLKRRQQQHSTIDRLEYSFVKLNIDCSSLSVTQTSKYLTNA
jgi:hypothetical protein